MSYKQLSVNILLLWTALLVSAQESTTCLVQGTVRDSISGETLIGVNVYLKDSREGTITDFSGQYSITLRPGTYDLIYSYMGYQSKEIQLSIKGRQAFDITLVPTETQLEEVRISAQRQFFGDLGTGRTIQRITAEEIQAENSNNVSDVLHARLSGIWSTKTSGAPGDHMKIRVRGMNSLFASDDPLYVVDGVQIPNVNLKTLGVAYLNTNDIENITVLKSASATALYGYQGGNGVIIIDTKRGSQENRIDFSTRQGFQWFSKRYDLMNTKDFYESMDLSYSIYGSGMRTGYPAYSDTLADISWQDEVFCNARVSEYQLSGSGTLGKTNYYLSGGYYDQTGIIKNSAYSKYSFSANLGRKLSKNITLEISYKYSHQQNKNNLDNYLKNEPVFFGINRPPCLPSVPDSLLVHPGAGVYFKNYLGKTLAGVGDPWDTREYLESVNKSLSVGVQTAHTFINYRITPNLNFNFNASYTHWQHDYGIIIDPFEYGIEAKRMHSSEKYKVLNHQYNLSYIKSWGKHELNIVSGIKAYYDNVSWRVDSADRFRTTISGTLGEAVPSSLWRGSLAMYGSEGAVTRAITSYVSHINYTFQDKYTLSVAGDYDLLNEGTYVDLNNLFYSFAANWNIAKENWFNFPWINSLNLYTNYGKSGNYPLNGLSNELYSYKGYTEVDTILYGYAVKQLANHYLTHEQVYESNAGVNLALFSGRIKFQADIYNKFNKDLIIQRDIPPYYGGGKLFLNLGEVQNRGYDINLELIPVQKSNFLWYTRFIFSKSFQKILKMDVQDTIDFRYSDYDELMPDFRIIKGAELGSIMGYKYLGKWTSADEANPSVQYIKFYDSKFLNADTTDLFGTNDKVVLGNSIPEFTCSWYNSISWKQLKFSMLWYAVVGVDKYNATQAASYASGVNREINSIIADSTGILGSNFFYQSSYFVEDASFLRLKTLTITLTPKKKLIQKISYNLSLSFENLLTLTNYKGYDPESTVYTDNLFSDNALDRGNYPIPRSVFLKINLSF